MSANFRRKRCRPPTTIGAENYNDCPFLWYQNIRSALFGFDTEHSVTDGESDRQTNGQNYDFEERASIAARAVKIKQIFGESKTSAKKKNGTDY